MHSSGKLSYGVNAVSGSGMVQYFKHGSAYEFVQLNEETGDVLCSVRGSYKHYSARSGGVAGKHIANSMDFTPAPNDKNDYSFIKLSLIPCGTCVVMFQRDGEWICAAKGYPVSEYWLSFVRSNLERYGIQQSDLTAGAVYTFICQEKRSSPANQETLFLLNEYNTAKNARKTLVLPRPEQISIATDKFLKYNTKWHADHLTDIIKQYYQYAYNFVCPVQYIDVRFGNYTWRVLTDAGEVLEEFQSQTDFNLFRDYAVSTYEKPYQQAYLTFDYLANPPKRQTYPYPAAKKPRATKPRRTRPATGTKPVDEPVPVSIPGSNELANAITDAITDVITETVTEECCEPVNEV